ncbi:Beta-glucosidase [Quillaja saponaria]|uniref:Beta-glucosidase n=1 Tax=Quillaja saponaria TaxID=32244 RepID=A0AAD7QHU6_QUISA|nr:Beta-glucosidase [Quillaja saponaria]
MTVLSKLQVIFLSCLTAAFFFPLSSSQSWNGDHEEIERSQFPNGFLFGTSTSAYQVEGAYLEDGKGLSNWDVFSHIPGKNVNNENGDVAVDHYHRYLEDINLMHSLGVNAYRFSISWARILPRGRFGDINLKGIMFYNKIIDYLLQRGIEPFVTIHHFDMPQELEDRYDGWLSPLIQEDFVHFAEICFKSFGDRVKNWTTINEPNYTAKFAYMLGIFPPSRCSPPFGNCSVGNSDIEPLIAMHNALLSHAMVADLYRNHFQPKQGGSIGIVVAAVMYEPLTDEKYDRQAVNRAFDFHLGWELDPLVFGDYPLEMHQILGSRLPSFTPKEKSLIKGSIDFIAINHYSTSYVKDCFHSDCFPFEARRINGYIGTSEMKDGIPIGEPTGLPGFPVVPTGMEKIIDYIKLKYHNMPMFVTENGYASLAKQNVEVHEMLQDFDRIEFHKAYLAALLTAIRKGADVRGYFIWSLMDCFQWTLGYGTRFGLYYVDPETLNRIPKLSANWFANFLTNTSSSGEKESTRHPFSKEEFVAKNFEAQRAEMK